MAQLKITTFEHSGTDAKKVIEYVAGMVEAGITSGILRDSEGNVICVWGEE